MSNYDIIYLLTCKSKTYRRKNYMNKEMRRSLRYLVGIILAVAFIVTIIVAFSEVSYTEKQYTVTVTDKGIKTSTYLVFTRLDNGEPRTFRIVDSLRYGRWNSSDVYADIQVGETYNFTVVGYRIPILSQYENIIDYSPI